MRGADWCIWIAAVVGGTIGGSLFGFWLADLLSVPLR